MIGSRAVSRAVGNRSVLSPLLLLMPASPALEIFRSIRLLLRLPPLLPGGVLLMILLDRLMVLTSPRDTGTVVGITADVIATVPDADDDDDDP